MLSNVVYPNNGMAYAYAAEIVPAVGSIQQGMMCNPVQLTASNASQILLNVTKDWLSQNHTIQGWLLSQSSGIYGRQVKITINQTVYWSPLTNQSGYFNLSLKLQPVNNNATTYLITATFEDNITQPVSATAWTKTLDSQQYPACTTLQYGYEPAFNTTTLTVLPASTEVATTTMSPEEMQQEAEDSGWLSVYNEFSWAYPWYRTHFVLNVSLPPYGSAFVDFGWSPLPLGISFQTNTTVFALMLNDIGQEIATDIILDIAIGYIIQHAAAVLLGRTLVGIVGALAAYVVYSLATSTASYFVSGQNLKAWLAAFVSTSFGAFIDLIVDGLNVLPWLTAVGRRVLGVISHTLNSMWARGLNFFDITGVLLTFVDFGLMILYLKLYTIS